MSERNYNLTKIKAFIGNDEMVMNKMIGIFLENTPMMISKIEEGLNQKDYDQVNFYAHKLKSSIDNFSIIQLSDDIRLIEKFAKEKSSLEDLPALVNKLKSVIITVLEEIKVDFKKD
jgi:HPt (histidine-containing phosphotransfer) domain-containing protein